MIKLSAADSEALKASFETALARALDKTGPAFTEAITPFRLAMDKAGKAAEKGEYGAAAFEMTKGVASLMGGPAGAILTTIAAANAVKTMLDPTATPFEKGAAMLVTGSSALLTAAGAISKAFGVSDPNADLAHLQQLKSQGPDELASLRAREKEELAKARPNQSLLQQIRTKIEGAERQARTIDGEIIAAQARVDALKAEAARIKAEEAAEMQRLQVESGLGPGAQGPMPAAAGVTSPIPAAALQQLQQLGAGRLAGVRSITDLLKMLNQPTSVKSREDLAKQLGYTGPLGGSAAMNAFLLDFFKKLAAAPPPVMPPPTVEPPPQPTGRTAANAAGDTTTATW